jgi:Protein of unknown function (DUF2934)
MRFPMQGQRLKVISICPDRRVSDERQEIADLAYELWLARGFRRGLSPEAAFLQAILDVTFQQSKHAKRAGLFLISKPDS